MLSFIRPGVNQISDKIQSSTCTEIWRAYFGCINYLGKSRSSFIEILKKFTLILYAILTLPCQKLRRCPEIFNRVLLFCYAAVSLIFRQFDLGIFFTETCTHSSVYCDHYLRHHDFNSTMESKLF